MSTCLCSTAKVRELFYRLQCELLQHDEDQSIFAWDYHGKVSSGLLADSPARFRHSRATALLSCPYNLKRRSPPQVSSEGIRLEVLMVLVFFETYIASLNPQFHIFDKTVWLGPGWSLSDFHKGYVGIYVHRVEGSRFIRIPAPLDSLERDLAHWPSKHKISHLRTITVVRRLRKSESNDYGLKPYIIELRRSGHLNDYWRDWLEIETVEAKKWHMNDNFWNINSCQLRKRTALTIFFKGYILFSLGNTTPTRSFPLNSFTIGFDSKSNFLCFVSVTSDSRSITTRFRDVVFFPYDDFERHGRNNRCQIDVQSCTGGQHRVIDDGTVAFRLRVREMRQYHRFHSQMELSTGQAIQLSVSRYGVLSVSIDVENPPRFNGGDALGVNIDPYSAEVPTANNNGCGDFGGGSNPDLQARKSPEG